MIHCPICFDQYVSSTSSNARSPIVGQCGHTLCRGCILQATTTPAGVVDLKCPCCNTERSFRPNQLTPNLAVMELLEAKNDDIKSWIKDEMHRKSTEIKGLQKQNERLAVLVTKQHTILKEKEGLEAENKVLEWENQWLETEKEALQKKNEFLSILTKFWKL